MAPEALIALLMLAVEAEPGDYQLGQNMVFFKVRIYRYKIV